MGTYRLTWMFHELTTFVTPLMEKYGALGVFFASIIEEIIAPIPSSVVVLSAGFFLTQDMSIDLAAITIAMSVMLPASIGIVLGSLFPYSIARFGGEIAIRKFGWLLGVGPDALTTAEKWFKGHKSDELLLVLVRAIPVIPSVVIGLFCGAVRMPIKEFLLYSFLGSLPRTFFLGMAGWSAGKAYLEYADQISVVEDYVLYIIIGVAAISVGWWFVRMRKKAT